MGIQPRAFVRSADVPNRDRTCDLSDISRMRYQLRHEHYMYYTPKYLFPTLSVRFELTITKLGIWWIVLFPTRANVRNGIEPLRV